MCEIFIIRKEMIFRNTNIYINLRRRIKNVGNFDINVEANGVPMSSAVLAAPLLKCITPLRVVSHHRAVSLPHGVKYAMHDARLGVAACVNVHCRCPTINSPANRRLPWIRNEVRWSTARYFQFRNEISFNRYRANRNLFIFAMANNRELKRSS